MAEEKIERIVDPVLFDVRCAERNIAKGLITRKEYEKHLASLEDKEELADKIEVDQERELKKKHDKRVELGLVDESASQEPTEISLEDSSVKSYYEDE